MANKCMGIINLNKKGSPSINKLNYGRPISSTPIGGRYRMIDFVLSNMVNSGINNIGIFAKEKYRSLTDHLGSGKDWDLSRKKGGLSIFSPEDTEAQNRYPYRKGDIHNILCNIGYIERSEEEYVLISPTYMICNIDYSKAVRHHIKSGNDITVIYKPIDNADEDFNGNLTLNLDENKNVINIGKNLGIYKNANIFMEMYIMKREDLIEMIYRLSHTGEYLYIEDCISEEVNNIKVGGYEYDGYLKCVKSTETYFELSKDLLKEDVARELLYSNRRILTKERNESPTKYTETANVENSFIATGCIIEGVVKNSIIFRKVHIKEGAIVENCIVMQNCTIDKDVKLENVIFDKNITIGEGKRLKGDENYPIVLEKNISI